MSGRFPSAESERMWRAKLSRRDFLRCLAASGAGLAGSQLLAGCGTGPAATTEPGVTPGEELTGPLNVQAWFGYDNPEVVALFEERYGVELNVKIAHDNASQVDQLRSGTGEFDVSNPDNQYVQLLAQSGLIQPLNRDDYPHLDEMFGPFKKFEPHHWEGQLYGVPVRWGINGIVHWPDKLSVADAEDGWVLWEERFRESIVMMDWADLYQQLVGLYQGNREPWKAVGEELAAVTDKLIEMKPNVRSLVQDIGTAIQDMANRDAAIAWGCSSNDTAVGLRMEGHDVILTIPKQGGTIWTEALVISKDTPHYATAVAYLDFMTSPEVQGMLAWSDDMKIAVCNARVEEYLTAEQFEMLNLDKTDEWVSNSVLSQAPVDLDASLDEWERFKAA